MPFQHHNQLKFYSFDLFSDGGNSSGKGVYQGIFTRHGGVSPQPWASLNTGGLSGDTRENVIENRRRVFDVFGLPVESLFDVWQVHGDKVISTNAPRPLDEPHQKADAIITNRTDITLMMRFGDCVPVFFWDPIQKVVAIAHAGWPGTVAQIVVKTVNTMCEKHYCETHNILAGIGPSISAAKYEVKEDVTSQVRASLGEDATEVILASEGRTYLDLWRSNQILLQRAGLLPEHIQISNICTASNIDDWYSHRGEHGKTGRFAALIALK